MCTGKKYIQSLYTFLFFYNTRILCRVYRRPSMGRSLRTGKHNVVGAEIYTYSGVVHYSKFGEKKETLNRIKGLDPSLYFRPSVGELVT